MTTPVSPLVSTEGYAVCNLGRNVGQPCRYQLIAEAIAAGKVRHIPRGLSGLPEFALSAEPIEPEA